MKYDSDGIICGLEDIEHISNFLDSEDAAEYFEKLKNELPWQEIKWGRSGRPLPRLVCRYGDIERQFRKYNVLEELIKYIETIFETDVHGVWCNLYRRGEDYTPYHQDNYEAHALTLSFGEERKFSIRKLKDTHSRKDFLLKSGDLFYFSPAINRTHEHTIPKTKKACGERISIVFFTDEPYIHRKRHLRHINVLGYGDVPVVFEGEASQFPDDAVATMLSLPSPNIESSLMSNGTAIIQGLLNAIFREGIQE